MTPTRRERRALSRRNLPPTGLGDLLAGRTERVPLGIATRHPDLAAQGLDRGPVDHALHHRRSGADVVALLRA